MAEAQEQGRALGEGFRDAFREVSSYFVGMAEGMSVKPTRRQRLLIVLGTPLHWLGAHLVELAACALAVWILAGAFLIGWLAAHT